MDRIVKWIDPPFFFVYNLDMAKIYIGYLANQLRFRLSPR